MRRVSNPGCGGDFVVGKLSHSDKNFNREGTQVGSTMGEHLSNTRTTSLAIKYCSSSGYSEPRISEIQRNPISSVSMASSGSRWVTATSRERRPPGSTFPSWIVVWNCWSKSRIAVLSASLTFHEQIECKEWETTHILLETYKSRKSI